MQDAGLDHVDHADHAPERLASLLAAAARGEAVAWRELVGCYGRRVYALTKSRCRDAELAEEITQSVFVTIAQKLGGGEYLEQGRFESWLFRIAMNRLRDHARRQRTRPAAMDPEAVDREESPEAASGTDPRDLQALRHAMLRLSEPDREVIELRHHGGLSFKQISELLDEPLGTLLARHHRALRKLKELIEAKESVTQAGVTQG
jgi:RNA polymerase sigma-70 factor (ECF subfamily)